MKTILYYIKTINLIRKNPGIFQVVTAIFDLLNEVKDTKECRMTKIQVDINGDKIDLVNLWAAIGDNNPIKRIDELKKLNSEQSKKIIQLECSELP